MKKGKEVRLRDLTLMMIVSMIITIAIMVFIEWQDFNNGIKSVSSELIMIIFETLLLVFIFKRMKYPINKIILKYEDFKSKLSIKEIIGRYFNVMILNVGGMFLFVGIVIYFNKELVNSILNQNSAHEMLYTGSIILNAITMVIMAPIAEEIVFRKIIFKRIEKKTNTTVGIIVSSILFGLLHATDSILFAMLFGVVFCVLYKKYNNILISMFMHFFNNLMSVILMLTSLGSESPENTLVTQQDGLFYLILGIILTMVGLYFYIKYIKQNNIKGRKNKYNIDRLL